VGASAWTDEQGDDAFGDELVGGRATEQQMHV
jgi:hypothetical protein